MTAPGFWMHEATGVLRPAIEAYLLGDPMTDEHIVTMRAYLRQWISAPAWKGEVVEKLRRDINGLTTRQAINAWLATAIEEGIDPL